MELDGGDPSGVNKNPKLIRAAQEDISKLDVLVCGSCHHVFHFVEEFQQHKENQECQNPTFKANLSETKPQVWAFLLWKSAVVAQQRQEFNKENLNSWKLYQKWCKMKENVRNSWIAAGKTIQSFSVLSNAKLQEIHKVSPEGKTKTASSKSSTENEENDAKKQVADDTRKLQDRKAIRKTLNSVDKNDSIKEVKQPKEIKTYSAKREPSAASENEKEADTPLETSDVIENHTGDSPEVVKTVDNEATEQESLDTDKVLQGSEDKKESLGGLESIEIKEEKLSEAEEEIMEEDTILKASDVPTEQDLKLDQKKKSEPTTKPVSKGMRPNLNKDADEGSSEDEYVVEKILAKRFNPRRKYYEYLLKWEGYPHDQNTWEPVHNMAACDKLVETFERNLARQKAAQQQGKMLSASTPTQKMVGRTPKSQMKNVESVPVEPGSSGIESRPVRSSKKKALAQVKSWCGSMAKKSDSEMGGGKRKAGEDSDSEEDDDDISLPEKKVKLEPMDDDEWSSGEAGASSTSSIPDDHEKHRNTTNYQGKLLTISKNKEHVMVGPTVKRPPGRPRKIRPEESTVNGITVVHGKKDDGEELALKLGLESESSPENKGRSLQPNANKSNTSQPPVLVANSKGVIKVDPRQVPNLTSGVYIVSNKSGVVKLESVGSSPSKVKTVTHGQSITTIAGENKAVVTQSGIIRKPIVQATGISRVGQNQVKVLGKPGNAVRPQGLSPGLVRVSPTSTQLKNLAPRLAGQRAPLTSPRVLGPRMASGTRPASSVLAARPGLASPVRPALSPRLPGLVRPQLGIKKSPISIPGVQTKIMRAVSPRLPVQGGKIMSSLSAQTRSGVKPIQAMLGKAVQGNNAVSTVNSAKVDTNSNASTKLGNQLGSSGGSLQARSNFDDDEDEDEEDEDEEEDDDDEDYINEEEERRGRGIGRGRGRRSSDTSKVGDIDAGKQRDSKLVDSDGVHMEFQEVTSSDSESDDSFPELPLGELPSLEPESPPRPFTLCPETGKILSRAEGEPTPPPSPELKAECDSERPPETLKEEVDEPEEILPDPRPASPLHKETMLKVEMSPGGTTGTVVESDSSESRNYMDTMRTEQGLTVTKIAESGGKRAQQGVSTNHTIKGGSGISVPARKLYLDGGSGKMSADIVTVTGEDGVVYQIATEGQQVTDEAGQQCVYVATEGAEGGEEGAVLTLDTAVAEAVAQLMPEQVNVIGGAGCSQFFIKEGEDGTSVSQEAEQHQEQQPNPEQDQEQQLVMTSMVEQQTSEDSQAQVVAHVVQEGELDPATGKRRVVLLLPDGNLMMTDVDEEQYAALNLEEK